MAATETHRTIEAIYRVESAKIIAGLARLVRDIGRAEELAQDALVAALQQWPSGGIPQNPGAWLMATAKHIALDERRRVAMVEKKHSQLQHEVSGQVDAVTHEPGSDGLLDLIFTACHPALSREAQIALTLRLVGGLTPEEIARAFLISTTTVQQRIVRAKKTLSDAKAPYEVPTGEALNERLSSVLEVIYLIFNEGYAATSGDDWMRPELCQDAMRLGRMLAAAQPAEPEVHALVALMELQASRMRARLDSTGEPVLLLAQNRAQWDWLLIQHGLGELARVETLGGAHGPYAIQAALAACHARARTADATDWRKIVLLYDALAAQNPSPVIALNRAIAVGMAEGPDAGLKCLDALRAAHEDTLGEYPFLWAARGEMLSQLGRANEAAREFTRAASLTKNEKERALMLKRAKG